MITRKVALVYVSIIALIILLVLSSCTQQRRIAKCTKWGVCKTDSVIITHKETVREEVFVVDSGYVNIDLLLDCDSLNNVYLKKVNELSSDNLDLKFSLKDGQITVFVKQPADTLKVYVKEIEKGETIVKTVEVNRLSKFQKFLIWAGLVGLGLIITGIIVMVIRFINDVKRT